MLVRQPRVVKAELMQDRRVQVGNGHASLHRAVADVVGRAVDMPDLEAAAGEMSEKALRLWSRPAPFCKTGKRPNSPVQSTSVSSSSPRLFRSLISAAEG
jgi:hypothetical protein